MSNAPSTSTAQEPAINPPFAYTEIVPLRKEHRVLLPQAGRIPPAFREINAVPISMAEFDLVARDYPIVFVTGDNGKSYAAFAVLGLESGRNLFVMSDNTWDRRAYVPAYVRRYPFCMSTITVDGQLRDERLVCVEKKAIRDKGDRLFDDDGSALPDWQRRQKLLTDYEGDLLRTNEMCAALAAEGVLEGFTLQAQPNEGAPLALSGMARVNEQKLAQLAPENIRSLMSRGHLGRVYAHLASINNFQRLLDRRASLAKRVTP